MARPTQADLQSAQQKLDALNERLSLLVERYDQATVRLRQVELELADERLIAGRAAEESRRARDDLSRRAAAAYIGVGSQLDVLLGATSFADLSARLEYVNRVARADQDAATRAQSERVRAREAAARLSETIDQRRSLLADIEESKAAIRLGIAEQEALVESLKVELAKPPPQPKRTAQPVRTGPPSVDANAVESGSNSRPGGGGGSGGGTVPPSPGADAVVAEAWNLVGIPYVWGSSDPSVGLDCSGLTLNAWAAGGVALPHSSQMQYDVTTRVPREELLPGDLLFFYSPIHHVAVYIGNNTMIHATHPGELSSVETIASYWWDEYVGAGRPGV